MSMPRDEWLRSRARARQRRPQPSIESCLLRARPDAGYDVIIRGRDLSGGGGVPTLVRVGGRPVRRIDTTDKTLLRGVVDDGAAGDDVVVDLGPAGRLTATAEMAP